MLALIHSLLLLSIPSATEPAQAETFAALGEAHLRRASTTRSLADFEAAHKNFDLAYLVADQVDYLCRALAVADLALRVAEFSHEQERLSWVDVRGGDLRQLGGANCRVHPLPPEDTLAAAAKPPSRSRSSRRVALIDPDGPPAIAPVSVARPHPLDTRRFRTHTAVGAVFMTFGVGLLGGFGGVLAIERRGAEEVKSLIAAAKSEERYYTPAEAQRFGELAEALVQGRNAAIGVGVAALATLTTGIVVLATRKRKTKLHRFALHPYGDLQGGGALLRLKF